MTGLGLHKIYRYVALASRDLVVGLKAVLRAVATRESVRGPGNGERATAYQSYKGRQKTA